MVVTEQWVNTPDAWSDRAWAISDSCAAVGWSAAGQHERFKSVLSHVQCRPGETLVDWGCGTGALSDRLPQDVEYVGYDTAAGMLVRARREHPGRRFTQVEPASSDVTVIVGALNLPGSKQQTWADLRRLWDKTHRVLAACLYAGTDDRCLIYTDDEVNAFARAESYHHLVERHRPNDLLMVLTR